MSFGHFPIPVTGKAYAALAWCNGNGCKADTLSVEQRYFINSIPAQAKPFTQAAHGDWGFENPLHWQLDVVFGDDASRIRKDRDPAILTSIRHLCTNLFECESSSISLAKKKAPQGRLD